MVAQAPAPGRGLVRGGAYECECGQVLRVVGGGRHAVFFTSGSTGADDPIMNRVCPGCARGLPGKGSAYA
jgi:hypothetical protein